VDTGTSRQALQRPPDSLNYFWDNVMALMQQGKVAELIMWNDATYAVAVDETASTVVGKGGFDIVPQGEGGKIGQVEGWTYLIPKYSKNPKPPSCSCNG